ncbi:MAG: efflux transporter outer membrane subunit [Synergistaceae bacterium]|jgi:NodT family efflux transporter outer membrane factor (OMF) lipoprotein|nr:efflux transporter outer membrane subunit [Synergistaceae bacterium]
MNAISANAVKRKGSLFFLALLFLFISLLLINPDEACAVSRDADLDAGDWTALARRYPNPYISDAGEAPSSDVLASWWETFGDETLTRMIRLSLKNNRDLQVARARVAAARATLGISRAVLLPWLDNADSWGRAQTPVEAGGSGRPGELFRLEIDASWEIDVFGGRRHETRAAAATLEAQYAALHGAWVSLSSEIALNYLSLRALQERLRIAESNLVLQTDTLDMVRSRYDTGLSDGLALNQAQYTTDQTRSMIPTLQTSIEETLNNLAILIGSVPGSLQDELSRPRPLPDVSGADLMGIPANALRQRPDIRTAERQLVAQISRKKSAQTDLWPKFRLSGAIGFASGSGGSLFDSASKLWSFGPQISLPLFHAGAIRKNIQVQTARQEQYLAAYEQTVLRAVAEVRNALTANVLEYRRNESLRSGVVAARAALAVANDKYRQGLSDFNNVIGAQRALLALEEACALSEGQKASNVVRIYKALGGGWAPLVAENDDPPDKKTLESVVARGK